MWKSHLQDGCLSKSSTSHIGIKCIPLHMCCIMIGIKASHGYCTVQFNDMIYEIGNTIYIIIKWNYLLCCEKCLLDIILLLVTGIVYIDKKEGNIIVVFYYTLDTSKTNGLCHLMSLYMAFACWLWRWYAIYFYHHISFTLTEWSDHMCVLLDIDSNLSVYKTVVINQSYVSCHVCVCVVTVHYPRNISHCRNYYYVPPNKKNGLVTKTTI